MTNIEHNEATAARSKTPVLRCVSCDAKVRLTADVKNFRERSLDAGMREQDILYLCDCCAPRYFVPEHFFHRPVWH